MKIYVRSAKINDAKLLIKIHNSSIKGGYFKSKNLINLKSHLEWLKKKIKIKLKNIYWKKFRKQKFWLRKI